MSVWSVNKILRWTTDYFKARGFEWPHLEAEILLAHALDVERIQLYIQHEKFLTAGELAVFKDCIERRIKHEPIAYITGYQPFMGLDFLVSPSVLIPRPETEKLVETAIELSGNGSIQNTEYTIADIGTGSGAIAVSLAKYLPRIKVIGIDLSSAALEIARQNAVNHSVAERCQFIQGQMLNPLKDSGPVDIIISNPPYIPTKDLPTLMADVRDFEPHLALDGGKDGLDYIRILINEAPNYLRPKGQLIFEFGDGQAENIINYASAYLCGSMTTLMVSLSSKTRLKLF